MQKRMPKVIVMSRNDLSGREGKTESRKVIYTSRWGNIRGFVWERVSSKGVVFHTLDIRRVEIDGSDTRFPYRFSPQDAFDVAFAAQECRNWLGFSRGNDASDD